MAVVAKFFVTKVEEWVDGKAITLEPVRGDGSPENAALYRYTPVGQIVLSTINADAAAQFEPYREYYVTFDRAG